MIFDKIRRHAFRGVILVLSGALVWPLLVAFPINGGDALWVSQSSRALVQCARDRVWSECPGTYQFGWLQHIPGIFLAWKGLDDYAIVTILTAINSAAFIWLIWRLTTIASFSNRLRSFAAVVLVAGPLYAFSVYSFSEMLTVALLAALVIGLYERWAVWQLFGVIFLLTSSRETAFTLVIPIAFCVLFWRSGSWRAVVKPMVGVVAASLLGLAAVLWFNVWKYGTITNTVYADPIRRVPGLGLKLKNFAAIWISPSGGVFPFWFLGGLVALSVPVALSLRWRADQRRAIIGLTLLAVCIFQTALLSAWFAPFGWVTWGPRLILPTVSAVVLVVLVLFPGIIGRLIDWIKFHPIGVFFVLAGTLLSGLANLGFILNPGATLLWFTPPNPPGCPVTANIEIDREYYFDCALEFAPWQLGRTIWDSGLHQVTRGWSVIFIGLVTMLTLFAVYARDGQDRQREQKSSRR